MTTTERFHDKWMPVTESGCHLWVGAVNEKGYGLFSLNGRRVRAHRVAYEKTKGPIPPEKQIDHLCRVPCCVNPNHLELVTSRENTLRGYGPTALHMRKTHCRNGHPLSGSNLSITKNGKKGLFRRCLICHLENVKRYTEKHRTRLLKGRRERRTKQ
jgi:hypothetical protein